MARELALFKIAADGGTRAARSCRSPRSSAAGSSTSRAARSIVEVTGTDEKIEAFEQLVRPFGLIEMVRTGEIAISRGRGET